MGLRDFVRGNSDRVPEEREVDRLQHRAYRDAGNQAAGNLRGDGGLAVHDMLNAAVTEAEKNVPWWRR